MAISTTAVMPGRCESIVPWGAIAPLSNLEIPHAQWRIWSFRT